MPCSRVVAWGSDWWLLVVKPWWVDADGGAMVVLWRVLGEGGDRGFVVDWWWHGCWV